MPDAVIKKKTKVCAGETEEEKVCVWVCAVVSACGEVQ